LFQSDVAECNGKSRELSSSWSLIDNRHVVTRMT